MPIESAMDGNKLHRLTVTEYNLIANKDPRGSYDRATRENLTQIIEKLSSGLGPLSPLEMKLYDKFHNAQFQALEERTAGSNARWLNTVCPAVSRDGRKALRLPLWHSR